MNKQEKVALLENGGLFEFTFKDKWTRKTKLYGRVKRVTNNGTKTQLFMVVENESLIQFLGNDERGNLQMKKIGTYELSYNGFLNLSHVHDIKKVKD